MRLLAAESAAHDGLDHHAKLTRRINNFVRLATVGIEQSGLRHLYLQHHRMNLEFDIKKLQAIYVSSVWRKRAVYNLILPTFVEAGFRPPRQAIHRFSQIE
jgi:hypothetical protein